MSGRPDFKGRIALVTGASRGLGAALSLQLASHGAHVVMLARSKKRMEKLDDQIREAGGQATLILCDLRKSSELDALGPALAERFGKLDILVGNAAILGPLMPVSHYPPDLWEDVFATNVHANYRLLRSLDPLLRVSDAGRALFMTSSVASQPRAFWGPYAASKAALVSVVGTYAQEILQTNIRVNCIDPGRMRTEMRSSAFPGEAPETLPDPADIARKLLPLLAPDCKHQGAHLSVKDL